MSERPLYSQVKDAIRRGFAFSSAAIAAYLLLPSTGFQEIQIGLVEVKAVPNQTIPVLLLLAAIPDILEIASLSIIHTVDVTHRELAERLSLLRKRGKVAEAAMDFEGLAVLERQRNRGRGLSRVLASFGSFSARISTFLAISLAVLTFAVGVTTTFPRVTIDSFKIHDGRKTREPFSCKLSESASNRSVVMSAAAESFVVSDCQFFDDNGQPVEARRHTNPDGRIGGWIAVDAKVPPSAIVDISAKVGPGVTLPDNARVGPGTFILKED